MNLTAIIINFLREPYLYKCLESLKAQYPDIKIIVGENGKYTEAKKKIIEGYGAKYIEVAWDAGICVARNKLAELADTDYILVGDDDFFYTEDTKIDLMLGFIEKHPEFTLIGGRIFENEKIRDYQGFFDFVYDEKKGHGLVYQKLQMDNWQFDEIRYKECDLVFNFFVGRKKDILDVRWDENIKVSYEHSTFFIDMKRLGKRTVFTPDAIVVHKPDLGDDVKFEEYKEFRNRRLDKRRFYERNGIVWCRDMFGNEDTV